MTAGLDLPAETATADPPSIRISAAHKHFRRGDGSTVRAVDGVGLTVAAGEFVVLLGPSGCGKTTLLRSIAGLETLDEGTVEVHGRTLFDRARRINLPPERRQVGMMFQSYALWPHLSVAQNVAYPLRAQKVARAEATRRVAEILDVVGIGELRGQYPAQISGGQQQRVALARALACAHDVVLFDEPLSNVDARVRDHLRTELARLHRELGFTAVYVTHDQDEALSLATRVTVLRNGKVAQSAPPREVYERPANPYVARFMGTANEIPGRVLESFSDGRVVVRAGFGPVTGVGASPLAVGEPVIAFSRPEMWRFSEHEPATANRWRARREDGHFHGFYTDHLFRLGTAPIRVRSLSAAQPPTAEGWLAIDPGEVRVLPEVEP
ncbi:ABC transporter ATP-binding protein [Amycolatopsis sp.]|uniref:ABC transporter ATP-binding protein n=1 Tax=Amycolatopsis sp. TaxID=37632 RepID=UPI002B86F0ED|nr:ABC transporter ATP-binding protein [Amycolatopsis sp.]HVV08265.1 ABC transporter ATP-binding protein [Amycolatopsis sp.]